MRKIKSLIYLTLLGLALTCGQNDSMQITIASENERFQLIKIIEPKQISSFNKFIVQQDKIYASDYKSRLYIFNLDGQIQTSFAGEGEGAGELQLLTDFALFRDQLVAVGYPKKMLRFDPQGILVTEAKLPLPANGLFLVNSELCFITRPLIPRANSNLKDYYYKVQDMEKGHEIFSVLDDTVQFDKEGRSFPYIVAPFPNMKFYVNTSDGHSCILSAQEKKFFIWEDGGFKQSELHISFPETAITEKDKQDFFIQIKKANSAEISDRIKKSVQFPTHKEYFMGVIPWQNNLALIRQDKFVIITPQGNFVEDIALPKEIKPDNYWDFFYISRKMQLHENHLYFLNENEEVLQVFKFSSPPQA